jgi:hypothetical protein
VEVSPAFMNRSMPCSICFAPLNADRALESTAAFVGPSERKLG